MSLSDEWLLQHISILSKLIFTIISLNDFSFVTFLTFISFSFSSSIFPLAKFSSYLSPVLLHLVLSCLSLFLQIFQIYLKISILNPLSSYSPYFYNYGQYAQSLHNKNIFSLSLLSSDSSFFSILFLLLSLFL